MDIIRSTFINLFKTRILETLHASADEGPCPDRPPPPAPECAAKPACPAPAEEPACPVRPPPGPDDDCGRRELPAGALAPGLLRHIHNEARYRLPQCFEGVTVSAKRRAPAGWVLGHSMAFSSVSPGGYKLLLSYLDEEARQEGGAALRSLAPYGLLEVFPGSQASLEARACPCAGARVALLAQAEHAQLYSLETMIDLFFNSFTVSLIAMNKQFVALHFLQKCTDTLSIGAELVSRAAAADAADAGAVDAAGAAAGALTAGAGALRWARAPHCVAGTLGSRGLDLSYACAVRPDLTVISLMEIGFAARRAVATLGYEWRRGGGAVRGSVDSDGLVAATVQHRFAGRRCSLGVLFSALLNHANDKFRVGLGVTAAMEG